MKNFLPALLPALALLTLGGCAGSSALTTTESDGVYYTSKDKTTLTASAASGASYESESGYEVPTDDEAANPDYNGAASSSAARSGGSAEYYDEGYSNARLRRSYNQPYRGMGLSYYDLAYADPFFYGGGFSPYGAGAFYDPFFSPYGFGNPYAFGGGSFVSIGFGNAWGNPWARPWARPFGYGGGYGLGYYDGFYNGYYGGLGSLGYGGLGYGPGYRNVYSRAYSDNNRRDVNVAPRRDRSSQAYNLNQQASTNGPVMSTRSRSGNVVVGGNGNSFSPGSSTVAPTTAGRGRGRVMTTAPDGAPQPTAQPSQPGVVTGAATGGARRWRTVESAPATSQPQQQVTQQETRPSRRMMRTEPSQQVARPQRSESYEQPTRTYSRPSRSESYSSPSMSSPSNSGGSSGGSRGRVR